MANEKEQLQEITRPTKRIMAVAGSNGCLITDNPNEVMMGMALFDNLVAKEFADEEAAKKYAFSHYVEQKLNSENMIFGVVLHFPKKYALNQIWLPENLSVERETMLKRYLENTDKLEHISSDETKQK